uniref:Uncharacterized protein n=1 Tax=Fagus sylvatica TaxID=28930 RepID=A0A2N9H9C6_FAGSY
MGTKKGGGDVSRQAWVHLWYAFDVFAKSSERRA